VFQPNFRGSDGYGARFRAAGYGEWGRKMQTDVSDGLAELGRLGVVDPKRACIVGAGYGGYAALAGVTVQQGFYRCAVSVAGIADPGASLANIARWSDGPDSATRYWRRFMGVTSLQEGELKAVSPFDAAARADAPILLVHGTDDTVVPIDESRRMAAALRAAGKPVELIELPHEDHWLSHATNRIAMLTAAVAFVEKYDPPDPSPAAPGERAAGPSPDDKR
jgi:dipeptidyl aminopeptidase/acylaminoacyl peptidase